MVGSIFWDDPELHVFFWTNKSRWDKMQLRKTGEIFSKDQAPFLSLFRTQIRKKVMVFVTSFAIVYFF